MEDKYSIRVADKNDVGQIKMQIRGLAKLHNLLDLVTIGEKELAEDLSSWYSCILLEYKPSEEASSEVVGHALWNYCYSTWLGRMAYLSSIFVDQDHRGRGCGMQLMQRFAKICHEKGCKRLRWAALHENGPAREFYLKMKAQNVSELEDWELMRIKGEEFTDLVRREQEIPLVES